MEHYLQLSFKYFVKSILIPKLLLKVSRLQATFFAEHKSIEGLRIHSCLTVLPDIVVWIYDTLDHNLEIKNNFIR